MTRREFSAAALALLPAGARAAETAPERGKRVIDLCIQALGGDAFRQLPGHEQIGSAYHFYADELDGLSPAKIYTKYLDASAPFREVQRQVFGKKDEDVILLSATEGWEVTYRGAEALPKDRIDTFRDTLLTDVFYMLRARINEPGIGLFGRGADVVENQPVEIVDIYDNENRNTTVWIHSSTWLPVRQLVKRWDPLYQERRDEMTRFTKYGDAGGGVMWPRTIQRERDGQKVYQLFMDSVKVGVFDDSMFKLPPGTKMVEHVKPVKMKPADSK
ncbi:MAG TPA: hypothetical protein VHC90_15765 [Bryobacteraceae bacterium]|nr:hypothetical protein [Bryobacteraceae bacterium]